MCEGTQLVGSDGAGTHALATLGGLLFDSAEACALPLSHASLDRCVGVHLNGAPSRMCAMWREPCGLSSLVSTRRSARTSAH